MLRLPAAERNRAVYNLRLAEQLGAETITLRGSQIAAEIIDFARQRQIAKIVAGKPTRHRWGDFLFRSPVDDLVRLSGEIDVLVTTGAPGEQKEAPVLVQPKPVRLPDYEVGLIYVTLATGLCFLMYPYFDLPNLIMVYLLAVMVTAVQCGRGPAILNSLLGVLTFDFCFVPPRWSFTVEEAKYVVTFVVMFLVAVVIGHLTSLIKRQAEAARLQERQTAAMHALSRQLAGTRGVEKILQVAVQHISAIFQCQVVALLPDETQQLHVVAGDVDSVFHQHILKEMSVAQWTYEEGQIAGWGTQDSRSARESLCTSAGSRCHLGGVGTAAYGSAVTPMAAAGAIAPPLPGIFGQAGSPGFGCGASAKDRPGFAQEPMADVVPRVGVQNSRTGVGSRHTAVRSAEV